MKEHIGNNSLDDWHVVITWEGSWYKLPFFLLEDWCHEWGNSRFIRKNAEKHGHVLSGIDPDKPLRAWLERYDPVNPSVKTNLNPLDYKLSDLAKEKALADATAIEELKEIIKDEMPALRAYKMYDE